jgi:His-Xaa-Ser system protein HxsD
MEKKSSYIYTENYSSSAIHRAMYDLADEGEFRFDFHNNKPVIELIPLSLSLESFIVKFLKTVLDHQLRIDAETQFSTIREIIVAQALQPRQDLQKVLDYIILKRLPDDEH